MGNREDTPINSSEQTRDLFTSTANLAKKLEHSRKTEQVRFVLEHLKTSSIENVPIYQVVDFFDAKIGSKKNLDLETKLAIKSLLLLTLATNRDYLSKIREKLFVVVKTVSENKKDLQWFYDTVISNFTESQVSKLVEAYGLDPTIDLKYHTKKQKIEVLERLLILSTDLKYFPKGYELNYLNKNDSASFFGLDNSTKEAVCWQELEMSRSHNKDLARIAATIAWKTWLYKKPLLKEYCKKNNIDHGSLSFSQKAKFTKEAVDSYSEEETAEILEASIEKEVENRKSVLKVEKDVRFIDKRVTMGSEMEIGVPPFEAALIYAWYENLDREPAGDSVAYPEKIKEMFDVLATYYDKKQELVVVEIKLSKAEMLINKLTAEKSETPEIREQVVSLINDISEKDVRLGLLGWLETEAIIPEFLEILTTYWENKSEYTKREVEKAKSIFTKFLVVNEGKTFKFLNQRSVTSANLPDKASNEAKMLLGVFGHHMGQIQAFGHPVGSDAFGEYKLQYTGANFKQPYRVNLRHMWELAETGLHDLELKDRPFHTTIGWQEDLKERRLIFPEFKVLKRASVINFALMTSGWLNMEQIINLKEQIKINQKEGLETFIKTFTDTGRIKMLRTRMQDFKNCTSMEFRTLKPRKVDQVKLFPALGNLGTIMKAYLITESDKELNTQKADEVDNKLSEIWIKFENRADDIYKQFENIPPFYDANCWVDEQYLQQLNNFYKKIIEDLEKTDGVLAQMRKLIAETTKEIEAVFAG